MVRSIGFIILLYLVASSECRVTSVAINSLTRNSTLVTFFYLINTTSPLRTSGSLPGNLYSNTYTKVLKGCFTDL